MDRKGELHFLKIFMGVYVCVLVTQSCPTLCNPMDCVTLVVEKLPARAGDTGDVGSVPGSGRSPGGGNDNPPQYSCLENSMDRGA